MIPVRISRRIKRGFRILAAAGFLVFGALEDLRAETPSAETNQVDPAANPLADPGRLRAIRVSGGMDSFGIQSSEVGRQERVSKERIHRKQAQTVVDAVSNETGIDTQVSCANCGAKRVTINGLKGEHTTILIDGVPLHSTISSFYGLDAIPISGIESIEVSRGSGASLIAPEAIGGVINIITAKARANQIAAETSIGTSGNRLASILGTYVTPSTGSRFVLSGQLSNQGFWDVDRNGVTEAPEFANSSFFVKANQELGEDNQVEIRYARQQVGILGGTTTGTGVSTYWPTSTPPPLFENNDISKRYLDAPGRVTDQIKLVRNEGVARWKAQLGHEAQFQLTSGGANQKQDSVYMHGYDYRNEDWIYFAEARVNFAVNDHLFTAGLDLKNQDMKSESTKLYAVQNLPRDDFHYETRGAYFQANWVLSEGVEWSTALRSDWLRVQWLAKSAADFQIDKVFYSPRTHLKWVHSPNFTSRLSYGRGYRAPLGFFESQHGLNEYGFLVAVSDVEQSHAAGYSLTITEGSFTTTLSSNYTVLDHVAYAEDHAEEYKPAIYKNYDRRVAIWANDLNLSYRLSPDISLEVGLENYTLPHDYKQLLPVPAIERRARFSSDIHFGPFEWVTTFTWVDSRDLIPYGAGRQFRNYADLPVDPNIPGITADQVVDLKWRSAPAYWTIDTYLGWQASPATTVFFSLRNLLDYTQTGAGDSPLNWGQHGGNNTHFHLDNNHVWGPTRGRVAILGARIQL